MVKLKGPGLASSATGSLADSLIFSSNKGRAYLKKAAKPKQPRSKPQVAQRALMTFLASQWHMIGAPIPATWQPAADKTKISRFNAYVAFNIGRHRDEKGLTWAYPPTEAGSAAAPVDFWLTGHVRRLRFRFDIGTLNNNWGMYLQHVSGTGIQPTWQDVVHIIPTYATGEYIYDLTPLAAGTYWFTDSRTTYDGKYTRVGRWRSAVVLN